MKFLNIQEIIKNISLKFSVDPNTIGRNRQEIQIRCPKCKDKKYHLGLSFSKNAYNCFRCPFSGTLQSFLKANSIKFTVDKEISTSNVSAELTPILKIPVDFNKDEEIYIKCFEYLSRRGFDTDFVMKNFAVTPITDRNNFYFGYFIIKLNDYAFYARKFLKLSDKHQKHFIRKSDKNMKLYYSYEKNNSKNILVCESMLNLIKVAQYKQHNAVCIFGKTKWQSLINYLGNKFDENKKIILALDKDVTYDEIEKFCKKIQKNFKSVELFYLDPKDYKYNDLAMMNKSEINNLVENKKSIENVFLETINIF